MTRTLHIADDYDAPLKLLEQRIVIWGGSGAGKTTCARVLYEECVARGVVPGAVDLKADFWGLKSSRDGKSKGIPVVVFGGEYADIPITPDAGALLAAEIVRLRAPWVLDLEQFSKGQQVRFLSHFLPVLYDENREGTVIFFDEADRYAPQGRTDGEAAVALGATEDIAKRGRKHGIFPVFITQRNQALNKQVSELCDVAIVFRTPGVHAAEAVLDWFGSKTSRAEMDQMRDALSGLATGEGFLCSTDPKLRIFKRVRFRMSDTFDSSATPELGGPHVTKPKVLAEADIAAISERLATVVEEVRQKDPAVMRQTILDLRRQLAARPTEVRAETKEVRVEVPVLKDGQIARVEKVIERGHALIERLRNDIVQVLDRENAAIEQGLLNYVGDLGAFIGPLAAALASVNARPGLSGYQGSAVTHPVARPVTSDPRGGTVRAVPARSKPSGDTASLDKAQRAVLQVLAQYPEGCSIGKMALLAGYTVSGSFRNALSALRTAGFITGANGEVMRITGAGMAAGDWQPLPSGADLRDYWLNNTRLTSGARRVLTALVEVYPDGLNIDDVARRTGYEVSGSFRNLLSELRTAGLLEGRNAETMRASDILFQEAA